MTVIRDGTTGTSAEVNDESELVTRSIIEREIEHASILGKAYAWYSGERDTPAAGTMLFVRSDSDTPLILDSVHINGDDSAVTVWEIAIGDTVATPAGTAITGVNLNRGFKSTLAEATAYAIETGHTQGDVLMSVNTITQGFVVIDLTGVILRKNHFIQIDTVTNNDTGSATIFGHFAAPS